MQKIEETKIFKKISKNKLFKKCYYDIFLKNKEILLYIIFGVFTTLVNILTYIFLVKLFYFEYMISNVIAWVLSVLFAYITNRKYVFESKNKEKKHILKEIIQFFVARIFSLLVDMFVMYIGITLLNLYDVIVKIVANIIVILINYFLSKFLIFKKKG